MEMYAKITLKVSEDNLTIVLSGIEYAIKDHRKTCNQLTCKELSFLEEIQEKLKEAEKKIEDKKTKMNNEIVEVD